MEIDVTRKETRASIEKNVAEFSGDTTWGPKPNVKVIEMGKKFCDELIDLVDNTEDIEKIPKLAFFSDVIVRVFVAGTRYYEEISDDELDAISKIFDELRAIRTDFVNGCKFDIVFDKSMYVREIFLTNTVGREDYDCKYRQGMIFPNFCDVYEIVHKIVSNWEKLRMSDDFFMLFMNFRREWYHAEINSDYHGDVFLDRVCGRKVVKPENSRQDQNPRIYAREFLDMLDEYINK